MEDSLTRMVVDFLGNNLTGLGCFIVESTAV